MKYNKVIEMKEYIVQIFSEDDKVLYQKLLSSSKYITKQKDNSWRWQNNEFSYLIKRIVYIDMSTSLINIEKNQNFYSYLKNTINKAYNIMHRDTKDKEDFLEFNDSIYTVIDSRIMYKWPSDDNLNIVSMASDLLWYIMKGHYLRNGNKRTALVVASIFLYESGFYLTNTIYKKNKDYHLNKDFYEKWDEFLSLCIEDEIKKGEKIVIERINDKIKQNLMISFNYRSFNE